MKNSKNFSCKRCQDKGWLFDDDPWLDFGGPSNYEILCDCVINSNKTPRERDRILMSARAANKGSR